MKYLFIDAKNNVSFDDDNYYLNGSAMTNEKGENTAALAKKPNSNTPIFKKR